MGLISSFKLALSDAKSFQPKGDASSFQPPADAGLVERFKLAQSEAPSVIEDEPMQNASPLITSFLREVEGFETTGYVPQKDGKVLGVSGVTVASGVDLGQQDRARLQEWGLPDDLQAKLLPYVGVKKDAATALLRAQPLRLTQEEADLLNRKVKAKYIAEVRDNFNRTSSRYKWDELPEEWQAVITSVGFQYGTSFKGVPGFWRQVTEGRWKDAYNNLLNFGDQYATRRRKEAKLVAGLLQWDAEKTLKASDIEVEDDI
jgi:hypothetical protein